MLKRICIYAGLVVSLAACGGSAETSNNEAEKSALEKTIAPQLDALEKAKGVEDALQQQVEKRDAEMRDKGI